MTHFEMLARLNEWNSRKKTSAVRHPDEIGELIKWHHYSNYNAEKNELYVAEANYVDSSKRTT